MEEKKNIPMLKRINSGKLAGSGLQQQMLPSSKSQKRYINDLQSEVTKSRMAIENISQRQVLDKNLYKKVQQLKSDLHHCIVNINQQTSKNKMLNELIKLLKGQMSTFQATQKSQQQFQYTNKQKKIRKLQYDTKQLLQKYNEEIAKINNLKDMTNAARDQRVVYSNLFNKIQKEIKRYQELYKKTLIKNQIFLQKKKEKQNAEKAHQNIDSVQEMYDGQKYQRRNEQIHQTTTIDDFNRSIARAKSHGDRKSLQLMQSDPFLTNIKQSKIRFDQVQTHQRQSYQSQNPKNTNIPKDIQNKISQKQSQIKKMVVIGQTNDIQQLLQRYQHITEQNQDLMRDVESIQEKISVVQEEIEDVKRQKRVSEIYQNSQIEDYNRLSNNIRSNKMISMSVTPATQDSYVPIIKEMAKMLEIQVQNVALNEQFFKEIDSKIDQLDCFYFSRKVKRHSRQMSSQDILSNCNDRGLKDLLDKIDKNLQTDKIMDRNTLKMQYQKELNKAKKKGKRTN